MHQFEMQQLERTLGIHIIGHGIGILQFRSNVSFMLFRQVVYDIAFLVDLTTLEEGGLASVPTDGRVQGFTAIQHIQPRRAEIHPRSSRSLNSAPTTVAFSVAPSRRPSTVLHPSQPMPKATIIWRSLNGVPSISTAHSRSSPSGRSINCFTFSWLASVKF
jgi:hypothetical protein